VLLGGCGGRAAAPPIGQPSGRPLPESAVQAVRVDADAPQPPPPDDPAAEATDAADRTAANRSADGRAAAAERPAGARSHTIRRGETLYSLARAYGVPVKRLMRANGITDPRKVPAGMTLVIPGPAPAAAPPPRPRTREAAALPAIPLPRPDTSPPRMRLPDPGPLELAWPLGGQITGTYGRRGRSFHEGLDIDGRKGQTVRAAAPGRVLKVGEEHKYGRLVVIDHGGGVSTLYAHASRILVRPGQRVARNDPIAEVGRTGNASGHHLHFEIRLDGRPIDPLPALRGGVLHPPVAPIAGSD
jgi:murein DD-endopeptidase MepM/ murein hydrolase activator NlpD